jgi:hypothetical protein
MLDFRNFALVDTEDFSELQLRHLLSFSQLVERHSGQAILESLLNPPLTIGRHRFDQFPKLTGWH